MRVALLIDSPPDAPFHRATIEALEHAAASVGANLDLAVHSTDAVPPEVATAVDGVVIGPGSPYRDHTAVWSVVRSARERGVPLVAT